MINSWGTNWGQGCFCWISYNDLADLIKYAFQAHPAFSTGSATGIADVLAGSLFFEMATGEPMLVARLMGVWMYQIYQSGTAFRFQVETDRQAFMYTFGTDDCFQFATLFPRDPFMSALLSTGSHLTLPGDNKLVTLDDRPGTDYYLLLLFDHELDPAALKKQSTDALGNLPTRLQTVFGRDLPNSAGVKSESNQARVPAVSRVVPLVIQFEHR